MESLAYIASEKVENIQLGNVHEFLSKNVLILKILHIKT